MEVKEVEKLIDKYLSGTADQEEKNLIENWYNEVNTQADKPDPDTIRQYKQETWVLLKTYTDNRMAAVRQIADRKKRTSFYTWLTAAMLLLSLAMAFYFLSKQPDQQLANNNNILKNDVLPGGNKAILTLSNGSQVTLTGAPNGLIAKQADIAIHKTEDGKLSYQASNDSGHVSTALQVFNTISTPRGGNYHLTLEDGTQVWLNAESSLKYPVAFKSNERVVELTGEGYFEVEKSKTRPFKINVSGQLVEVLGTHFNINAYNNEPVVKTTLLEGSVKISAANKSVLIKPGEQAYYSETNGNGFKVTTDANINEVMAWKNGRFIFTGANIQTVMRQLERWYDVDAVYDKNIPTDHFNGKIPKDVNLSQVLKVLELSGVHFKIEGRKIVIH